MPDPIQGLGGSDPVRADTIGRASSSQPVEQVQPASGSAADSADVGQTKNLLAVISTAAADTPVIDEARVAALQQAIANGTYQVNPQQIAQKLLDLDGALGATGTAP